MGQPAEHWNDEHYVGYFLPQAIGTQLATFNANLEQVRAVQPRRQYDKNLVGVSAGFKEAFELLQSAAQSAITVLLLGETGVGKEMFARWLHDNGPRSKGPFIAVNCAAIPHDLVEAGTSGSRKAPIPGRSWRAPAASSEPAAVPFSSTRWATCPWLRRQSS